MDAYPGVMRGVFLAYLLWLLGYVFYNLYIHALSGYPGPFLRKVFSFPSVWEVFTGTSVRNIDALHKKYGSVVRVAPDALSFSSAQAWKDIYGFKQRRRQIPKDYKRFPPIDDVLPILFSSDTDHARMRKLISHAFSESALKEQIPLVVSHMREFIHQLRTRVNESKDLTIDINEWCNYLAFDIVTDLSFGEPLGALSRGAPDPYIDGFFKSCRLFPIIPLLYEYSFVRLLFNLSMKIQAVKGSQEMGYLATKEKVERRMSQDRTEKKDFMTYILHYNDEKGMSIPEIIGSTTVFVNAGGEATAACICATIYLLLKNPRAYARVKTEVCSSFQSERSIETSSLKHLDYLNAVIEESLRIYPPTPGNFSRRTDVSTEIDGHVVPPGTSVGVHQYSASHSPQNFLWPEQFAPERWLKHAPKEYENDIREAAQPWGVGPRNCVGKSVAALEIRMALALLLWSFDMELPEGSKGWAESQTYNIVWNRTPLYIRLIPTARYS
ncbi:putative benzoate 4-monooxygenase cytochrome P450 [Hypoxylon rubiginosum]|uniref:Benzoate 4-monooxygenase cytochrome P450 n=1 Tax=Hypoxylon rubiginosum TaxID=110542 RepID=A0ACB9YHK4_9PEZI|nr:putative benzoate 4-monooxygenase cytochrome P450 [Hypoxylon rubiginosum]